MEALGEKRRRLHRELELAYAAWMRTSEFQAAMPDAPVDISGCPNGAKAEWFEYLAAKDRLVAAYAERSITS